MQHSLTWVEVSRDNLLHNVRTFKKLVGPERVLCAVVKANAYGHGIRECAPLMLEAGSDWLGVNSIYEAVTLRDSGIDAPIYVMGYIPLAELETALERGFNFVVYNLETLEEVARLCRKTGKSALTHLKLETGNNRQGVHRDDLGKILEIYNRHGEIKLAGVATHFANIEDTTDHTYADFQLKNFGEMVSAIRASGLEPRFIHCANTASTILYPSTYFNMVRAGIGLYGLWPSSETMISARGLKRGIELKPVLSWKTKIAQTKKVPAGSYIGYGCTVKTSKPTRLAVLPVGYFDGYDRGLSNNGYVLICGKRAPVKGRVCMNMMMVDVSNIPEAMLEDEVVLLGRQGDETLPADQLARWLGTIHYEVTTRINGLLERRVV